MGCTESSFDTQKGQRTVKEWLLVLFKPYTVHEQRATVFPIVLNFCTYNMQHVDQSSSFPSCESDGQFENVKKLRALLLHLAHVTAKSGHERNVGDRRVNDNLKEPHIGKIDA